MLCGQLRAKFDFSFQIFDALRRIWGSVVHLSLAFQRAVTVSHFFTLVPPGYFHLLNHPLRQRANVSPSQFLSDIRGNRKGSFPRLTVAVSLEQAKENPASRTTASVSCVYEPWG